MKPIKYPSKYASGWHDFETFWCIGRQVLLLYTFVVTILILWCCYADVSYG